MIQHTLYTYPVTPTSGRCLNVCNFSARSLASSLWSTVQEYTTMLDLELLSGRLRDRHLSAHEEARVALVQRDQKEMTLEQWQDFTDFFSAETQEEIVKHKRQIQAGITSHASQCIASSACLCRINGLQGWRSMVSRSLHQQCHPSMAFAAQAVSVVQFGI